MQILGQGVPTGQHAALVAELQQDPGQIDTGDTSGGDTDTGGSDTSPFDRINPIAQ